MVNSETGQPYPSVARRILVLTKMLQSGIPHSLNWLGDMHTSQVSIKLPIKDAARDTGIFHFATSSTSRVVFNFTKFVIIYARKLYKLQIHAQIICALKQ